MFLRRSKLNLKKKQKILRLIKSILERVNNSLISDMGKTNLIFVKGDAGSGKTTILQEITRQKAASFKADENKHLFLYVSVKGRALSNLNDAIAGELNDLRAGFTRDAVPTLVRNGLLIPIIDGFDELLGAAGYGDAFGSLKNFLLQLNGLGVIIVAARSSFYDIEFIPKTPDDINSNFELTPVSLNPWGEKQIEDYLTKKIDSALTIERDLKIYKALAEEDKKLLGKPFFVSLFPDYIEKKKQDINMTLIKYLVDSYITREAEKIVDRNMMPLISPDQHKQFFCEAAELMWSSENRDLSKDDLQTIAEMIAEDNKLTSDSTKQFITKITSYAGFKTHRKGEEQRFQFEHEVYFDYFLAQNIIKKISSKESVEKFLDRGLLVHELARSLIDESNVLIWIDLLLKVHRSGITQENRRRNAGTILANCFRLLKEIENISCDNLSFINVKFDNIKIKNTKFVNCIFTDVHLERTVFNNCEIQNNTLFERIYVTKETVLGVKGLIPGENVLCIVDVDENLPIYSPTEIEKKLLKIGSPITTLIKPILYSKKAQEMIKILEKIVRRFYLTNILCLEDDTLRILHDRNWPQFYKILKDSDIVSEEIRDTSGHQKKFFRPRVKITEIMRFENEVNLPNDKVGKFWGKLRSL